MGIDQSEELVDVVGNDSEEYLQRHKRKEWLGGGVEKKKSVEKWMMHVSNDIKEAIMESNSISSEVIVNGE